MFYCFRDNVLNLKLFNLSPVALSEGFVVVGIRWCRFEELLDANTSRLLMSRLAKRWINMRLCLVTSFIVSFIAVVVFLLRDVVPTSYAGAALVYAFQVCRVRSTGVGGFCLASWGSNRLSGGRKSFSGV